MTKKKIYTPTEMKIKTNYKYDWSLPMLLNRQGRVAHSDDKRNLGEAKSELCMVAEEVVKYGKG